MVQTAPQQAMPVDTMQYSGQFSSGQLFGLPGVTVWSEQKENNDATTATLAAGAQVAAAFPANFKQTDIVYRWEMGITITFGASPAATLNPYFPYNFLGPVALNVQNQFNTINVENGIDLAIFQAVRPSRTTSYANWMDANIVAPDAYSNTTPNLITGTWINGTSGLYTGTSTTVTEWYELMPAINFDLYYDLAEDGRLYNTGAAGIRAVVTPQMMAGTNRIIQPSVTFNQILSATNAAIAPFSAWTPQTTTATINFRRTLTYQPTSDSAAPLLFNWQYARDTRRVPLNGQTSIDIPLPLVGQILFFYIRLFDPTGNAPIAITTITNANVQVGSGLFRYQDTPTDAVKRLYRQHGIYLPAGCLGWDMAITDEGRVTNRSAINTLTTSGCTLHLDFNVAPSTTSYAVLGVESLRYVSLQ